MRWLLPWILATSSILQAIAQTSTTMTPTVPTTTEAYTRTQYCKWPCECPKSPPRCSVGVSLVTDGCDCCKTCAKQRGESCNEADTCDFHRGLYCDYSGDRPRDCRCRMCPQWSQLIKMAGKCCEQWICDDSKKIRKTSPRHISSAAYEGEDEAWQKNCIVHTSPWSPCSKTCGMGISTRISNDNDQCRLLKESRLCNMRPCEVDITKHIKPGKKCLAVYRASEPMNYTISGCVSKSPYRPKYCGVCTDNRCCTPYKSKTIEVRFQCPDGTEFSWKIMWINACFCNLNCKNPNDIFADLAHYHDYSEIAN
ncbi:WNT1-inducible-signaling pathway protein 1 isoform X2 [Athene cunicularia]|uniref:WNT1-inducible-signaling pathway protein 1 isoform X2 n=1 Tax=Athene cunicularia TaxID=194338 RepID=UPI000EF72A84|nr:WNT1-inducible-signaling pathway protein 1 isoform X2 [Athene cunicularia]